jgi:hypothetical protein
MLVIDYNKECNRLLIAQSAWSCACVKHVSPASGAECRQNEQPKANPKKKDSAIK